MRQPACRTSFKVPDLRNKILFTLVIIGALPARVRTSRRRGSTSTPSSSCSEQAEETRAACFGFLQLFSGGALTQFAIFALGIMPYITASIIMQILAVVIPKLEQWQQQGRSASARSPSGPATSPSPSPCAGHRPRLPVPQRRRGFRWPDAARRRRPGPRLRRRRVVLLIVLTLTAGTALLMWMGELITQQGIGNGMSLLIFASVVARCPPAVRPVQRRRRLASASIVVLAAFLVPARRPSCSSSRASGASRCSSPSVWWVAACTAARAPTSR